MEVEGRRRPLVRASKLGVAAVADRDVLQTAIDSEIYQRGAPQQAVGHQVAAEAIENRADRRADDDDGEPDFRREILPDVEIAALTDGAAIHAAIVANR